jgi:hypothetical protein
MFANVLKHFPNRGQHSLQCSQISFFMKLSSVMLSPSKISFIKEFSLHAKEPHANFKCHATDYRNLNQCRLFSVKNRSRELADAGIQLFVSAVMQSHRSKMWIIEILRQVQYRIACEDGQYPFWGVWNVCDQYLPADNMLISILQFRMVQVGHRAQTHDLSNSNWFKHRK